ncbi:hypothetical protein GcM3_036041 [Golovinomyces cichoracearum]|uniref:CCHC-type domain-containing protein n=1 Tax=Golovinomyces cichoracearum TaxID=62708 RepID=A0A420J3J7_9PEZI|nr:hypothetical protein GcM3_036041 [Golovinomyces cichoracearum]
MGILCIRCGEIGHRKPECAGPQLEWWEQSYLRDKIWPKVNVNSASLDGAGAGLKYREIQDSNWRKSYHNNSRTGVSTDDVQKMSFEEFTGEKYDSTGNYANQSMNVILGYKKIDDIRETGQETEKNVRFESDKAEEKVTLESFLNQGDLRKRGRPLNIEELLNKEEHEPKIRKKDQKVNEKRMLKHLR